MDHFGYNHSVYPTRSTDLEISWPVIRAANNYDLVTADISGSSPEEVRPKMDEALSDLESGFLQSAKGKVSALALYDLDSDYEYESEGPAPDFLLGRMFLPGNHVRLGGEIVDARLPVTHVLSPDRTITVFEDLEVLVERAYYWALGDFTTLHLKMEDYAPGPRPE